MNILVQITFRMKKVLLDICFHGINLVKNIITHKNIVPLKRLRILISNRICRSSKVFFIFQARTLNDFLSYAFQEISGAYTASKHRLVHFTD